MSALLVLLLAALPAGGPAPDGDVAGTLLTAYWRGAFLGRGADGCVALLSGPDGSRRAEVAAAPCAPAALLERRGRGWTLVLPARGDALVQPWGEGWRRLDAAAARAAGAVAEALATPEADRGPGRRVVLPPAGPPEGFRAALAARGRGRGGPGETLRLRWRPDAAGPTLSVRSSRRPGELRLGGLRCRPAVFPPVETFAPLWPLRDLIETGPENPGTCPPPGG